MELMIRREQGSAKEYKFLVTICVLSRIYTGQETEHNSRFDEPFGDFACCAFAIQHGSADNFGDITGLKSIALKSLCRFCDQIILCYLRCLVEKDELKAIQ